MTYDGPGHGDDWGIGCTVDNSGHFYMATKVFTGSNDDIYALRLNSSTGVPDGYIPYNNPFNDNDWGFGSARDRYSRRRDLRFRLLI